MLAKVLSSAVIGIDAVIIEVEVDISSGLPAYTTVGLPEASVKESKERVKSAIQNSGYHFPDDRITVNLAPANIKKEGTGFDLPMALGILTATGAVNRDLVAQYLIIGELSLDGRVKPVTGSLPVAIAGKNAGLKGVMVPAKNAREASVISDIAVRPVRTLGEVVDFFNGYHDVPALRTDVDALFDENRLHDADYADVMGQHHVKRALEIAAAGGHNLLMVGPPGSGKTMLARRLPGIMPPLTFEEAIDTTKIFSVVGMLANGRALVTRRPFRSPHHTISDAGLIGGGHIPRPGEVSLAHNGVLFLDELAEYKKHVLEVLRQPLEDEQVTISRAASTLTYPSRFMLVAATNPCPCGYLTDSRHPCRCTPVQIQRYRTKMSGPLMDRIDMHVDVPAVPYRELLDKQRPEGSADIRLRVIAARKRQGKRFRRSGIFCNAQMVSRQIRSHCRIGAESEQLLESAIDKLGLSARAHNRILKIARTIADLAGTEAIEPPHVAEAIGYRSLDRSRSPASPARDMHHLDTGSQQ